MTTMTTASKFGMTVDEAAQCTGIGCNTLRKLIAGGKLPMLRVGRKSIIHTDISTTMNIYAHAARQTKRTVRLKTFQRKAFG